MEKIEWYKTPAFILRAHLFGKLLPELIKGKFLEVGIGEGGGFLLLLEKRGFSGIGIDYSDQVVERAKQHLTGSLDPKIEIKKQDVWKQKGKFGLVVAMEVLEHCPQDRKLIRHFFRLLESRGFLIFSVPAGKERWGEADEIVGHLRRYEKMDLVKRLKKEGFEEIVIWSYGFPLLNISATLRNFWMKRRGYKKRISRKTREERTRISGGRFLKTPLSLFFNDFCLYPFILIQKLFLRFDLGVGYIIRARKI